MSFKTVLAYCIVAAAALAGAQGAFADGGFASLQPGVPTAGLDETVPVNIVFIGMQPAQTNTVPKPGQINTAEFLSDLPKESRPIVRSRLYYGITEELGIDYSYNYSTTFTTPAWDNSFFAALKALAKPAPRTEYQDLYNDQAGTRDVGKNNAIDAPSVEKWLIVSRRTTRLSARQRPRWPPTTTTPPGGQHAPRTSRCCAAPITLT